MTRIDPRIRYNFYFMKSIFTDQPVSWNGASIARFWNNVYDNFWNSGEMTLKKNVGEFTKDEIKKLFWDVFENMEEDNLIIDLEIINLHTLKFIYFEGRNIKIQSKSNLNKALEIHKDFLLKKLCRGFNIKIKDLKKKDNSQLKRCLIYYEKSRENKDNWGVNLYNIIERINGLGLQKEILKLSNITKKDLDEVTNILNQQQIAGSRHEGKFAGFREISKEKRQLCDKIMKELIDKLIIYQIKK